MNPFSLGQFDTQEQIDAVTERFSKVYDPKRPRNDNIRDFLSAMDEVGVPRVESPDSLLAAPFRGFAVGAAGLPKAGASIIEAVGAKIGSPAIKNFGQGAREAWETVQTDPNYYGESPQDKAFGDAAGGYTARRLLRGVGQGIESGAEMLAFGAASKAAALGRGATAGVASKIGKAAGIGVAAYQGGGATVGELNQISPQTPGQNLIAGAVSGIQNGLLDALAMERIPGWGNVPARAKGDLYKNLMGLLRQAGTGVATEATTEGIQSILDTTIKYFVAGEKAIPEGWKGAAYDALYEGVIGGLTGGLLVGAANIANVEPDAAPTTPPAGWMEKQTSQLTTAPAETAPLDMAKPVEPVVEPVVAPEIVKQIGTPINPVDPMEKPIVGWGTPQVIQREIGGGPIMETPAPPIMEDQGGIPEAPAPAPAFDILDKQTSDEMHKLIAPEMRQRTKINTMLSTLRERMDNALDNPTRVASLTERRNKIIAKRDELIASGDKKLEAYKARKIAEANASVVNAPAIRTVANNTLTFENGKTVNLSQTDGKIHGMEQDLGGSTLVFDDNGNSREVGVDSLITLVEPTADTLDHELAHAVSRLIYSGEQQKVLDRAFTPDKETQVEAYIKWANGQGKGHPLFRYFRDTVRALYQFLSGHNNIRKAEKVFREMRGDIELAKTNRTRINDTTTTHTTRTGKNIVVTGEQGLSTVPAMKQTALRDFAKNDILRGADVTTMDKAKAKFKQLKADAAQLLFSPAAELAKWENKELDKGHVKPKNKWDAFWDSIQGETGRGYIKRNADPTKSMVATWENMPGDTRQLTNSIMGDTKGVQNLDLKHVEGVKSWGQISKGWKPAKLDNFSRYLTALSTVDRHASGKGPANYSSEEAILDLAKLDSMHPDFVQAQKDFMTLSRHALHLLVESGNIDENFYQTLVEQYPHYVPFWKMEDLAGKMTVKGLKEVQEAVVPIKKAYGGANAVQDPLTSALSNMESYAQTAVRFKAEQQAIEELSSMKDADGNQLLAKLKPSDQAFREIIKHFEMDGKSLLKAVTDAGLIEVTGDIDGDPTEAENAPAVMAKIMLAAGKMSSNPTDKTFVRPVWEDGKVRFEVYQTLNRQLFNTFTNYNITSSAIAQGWKKVTPFLAPFARMNRAFITTTFEFPLANVFRDIPFHSVYAPMRPNATLREQIKTRFPLAVHLRGALAYMKNDKTRQMLADAGVSHSNLIAAATESGVDAAARKLRIAKSKMGAFGDFWSHPVEAAGIAAGKAATPFEWFSNWSETIGRLGVYDRVYKESIADGLSEEKAQAKAKRAAKNTTQNFDRMGSATQTINNTSAFFGAGVGGWYRMYEAAKANPKAMSAFAGIMMTGSIGLMLFNRRDDRWKDIPEWEKDMFWFLLLPGLPILRFPKPFEAGTFFGSVPERIMEMVVEDTPNKEQKIWDALTAFNLPTPVPTAMRPIWQNLVNRDWKGSPVVSRREEFLAPSEQYSPFTSETAKAVAAFVRWVSPQFIEETLSKARLTSPKGIDNIMNGLAGGMGRTITGGVVDPAIRAVKGEPLRKPGPAMTAADAPILRKFVSRYPSTSAQPIKDFNKALDHVEEIHNTSVSLRKRGDMKRFIAYNRDHQKELIAYTRMESVAETMSDLNKQYRLAQETPGDRDAKRKRMDYLAQRMARLAETANKTYARITGS